jgi:hypothetical protein
VIAAETPQDFTVVDARKTGTLESTTITNTNLKTQFICSQKNKGCPRQV